MIYCVSTIPQPKVSVLFSEPKIPQWKQSAGSGCCSARFSALQRAENSSIRISSAWLRADRYVSVLFSEPKIPQFPSSGGRLADESRFSALQRAENSSIAARFELALHPVRFQCSSASRKFLNRCWDGTRRCGYGEFQCSSASRKFLNRGVQTVFYRTSDVSVLFSEPKIPQSSR